jgi:hypothetical protein
VASAGNAARRLAATIWPCSRSIAPTKEAEPEKTEKPERKAEPAQRVTKRGWAKIVKNPDRYAGERYIIYGQVTQFDSATGDEGFRADTAHTNTMSYGFFDGKNTVLSGSPSKLDAPGRGRCVPGLGRGYRVIRL